MDPKDLPFPPGLYPFATNEQLRANDAYRDSMLTPELREVKVRQLLELCELLKAAGARARAEQRPPP